MRLKQSYRFGQALFKILFLKDRPLSVKLLVFLALLVVVPLTVVGLISYSNSSASLKDAASRSSWQIIEQVKSHIEYYIRDFEIDSIKLLNQPEMKSIVMTGSPDEIQKARPSIVQLFKDVAYSRPDISRITLLLENRAIFDSGSDTDMRYAAQLEREPWYDTVPMNGDIKLISRLSSRSGRDSEPVISIVKRIIDSRTLEPVGMLIMDINFKRIQEIAYNVTVGRSGYMAILDEKGLYIYHPDPSMIGQKADFRYTDWMLRQDDGYFQSGKGPFYTFNRSSYLNWHLVTIMPNEELNRGVAYIGRTIWLAVLITLLMAYLLAVGFAASIVAPIRKLQFFMKRVKDGNFSERAKVESKDEIGILTNDFNQMVEKVEQLMKEVYTAKLREADLSLRQKESELKVLQSQVNPHFLYNSLETVRGMALEHGITDISKLVTSLAKMLRYNLGHASPVVTLREELAICSMYLGIQKYRFEDKLHFRFEVPDEALEQYIPKFSLQPLVENCVIHGTETGTSRVTITISAMLNGSDYTVMVEDSGSGIEADHLRHIERDLREKELSTDGAHIGIINVHRRIMHLCGERYGLRLASKSGKGTTVTITLPLKEEGSHDAISV
ncbi:two-component system, sensor histidine kinase YesM [Paenibacillus catalpae]|uniref:histidine kinase n=1 Tax=Paenibacillus catalpae TaxID=1045775 RepID=A0A1I1X9U6_9BACL|nr:sensor histidine kinase [Paenibacillus catalpae]SFE04107.1 two-component system, sensor histidine kinase YesM [Paenibacillus catalpae]